MNKIMKALIILLSLFLLSCNNKNKSEKSLKYKKSEYNINVNKNEPKFIKPENNLENLEKIIPDTTINYKLFLSTNYNITRFYPDEINTIEKIRETPVAVFSNNKESEYLIAFHYEGSQKNSFDCFEVGYLKDDIILSKTNIYKTSEKNFITENKIQLNISFEELINLKGNNFTKKEIKDSIILTYRNDNFDTSPFLKRYNMPSYFYEFTLIKNKVVKFKFGFDYP
ncbi:MAG: hypothetical protein O9297_15230 [Flavobacterium sp.]|uniref:hypothetical protein n=1 Tax=Flavobacterium sp. TaxID=239 RepID=UPI0022C0CCA2|nr:hypothetical protein [Flavobacterium sp.]MCZ8298561.1 hypothetical protein [Flavobacterium sp.]